MILWILCAILFLFICYLLGTWVGYAIPIIRFLNRYDAVTKFYSIFKQLDSKYLSENLELTFSYRYGTYTCQFTYSTIEEAKEKFKNLIQEALSFYNEIDPECITDDDDENNLPNKRAKLIYIRNEIFQM